MKLHLGCGGVILDGYINVDTRKLHPAVYVDDVITLSKLLKSDVIRYNTISEILAYHVIEHLPRPNSRVPGVCSALYTWNRVLKIGGKLILECPDFDALIDLVKKNPKYKDNLFGLQRFPGDAHLWGYTIEELSGLLEQYGFTVIERGPGTDYHAKMEPCIRVVGVKNDTLA